MKNWGVILITIIAIMQMIFINTKLKEFEESIHAYDEHFFGYNFKAESAKDIEKMLKAYSETR